MFFLGADQGIKMISVWLISTVINAKGCGYVFVLWTPVNQAITRGSHIDVTCRSVRDRDQNEIKQSVFSLGADQDKFWVTNIKWSMHFLRYLAGIPTFCPLNSRRIKRSRASERSDQAIKDDFHRSRFLIPVANASTGDVYVTTPWMKSLEQRDQAIKDDFHRSRFLIPVTNASTGDAYTTTPCIFSYYNTLSWFPWRIDGYW